MLFIYDGSTLTIKNSKLDLNTIYEDYHEISSNNLNLETFIEDYKNNNESQKYEENDMLILETRTNEASNICKKLYISKKDAKPVKLEVKDITHKLSIYILYNEIEINNLQKDEILAFNLQMEENNI